LSTSAFAGNLSWQISCRKYTRVHKV